MSTVGGGEPRYRNVLAYLECVFDACHFWDFLNIIYFIAVAKKITPGETYKQAVCGQGIRRAKQRRHNSAGHEMMAEIYQ